jgi:hypothetical protein
MYPYIYIVLLFWLGHKSYEYDGWPGMIGVLLAWGIFNLFIV